jgi:PAS domain S-box-containing protein
MRRTLVSFVQEVDQVEQLRSRVADLEAQLDAERHSSEGKLRELMDKLPIILFAVDTNGIITLSEGKGLSVNGLKPGQAVGANIFDLYKNYPEAVASLKRALTGESFQFVQNLQNIYMQTSYSPSYDEAGKLTGTVGLMINVTDRIHAEAELNETNTRLKLAFKAANLASWDWNMVTNFTVYDDGFNRQLGLEPGTLGNDLSGFQNNLHPDDIARVFKEVLDYAEGRASKYQTEFRLKHKDGSYRWVYASGQIVERDADGKTVRMIGVNQDITARKQAEIEQRDSQNRLELAFKGANLASWDLNLVTNYTIYDDRYLQMLGYEPGELPADLSTFRTHAHPDDLDNVQNKFANYVAGRSPNFAVECRMKTKNGDWIWIHNTGLIAERQADGKPLRLIGVMQDITARKQAEIEIRDSKNRLELAMEGAGLGSWEANLLTNKTLFDARYEKMLGFAPGELAGENPTMTSEIHPDDMVTLFTVVMDYTTGKRPDYEVEFRTSTKDGGWKWIYAKAQIVERTPDGIPLRLAGINQDITSRKAAEQERENLLKSEQEARREAQEALRMKDLFLATMSHELRTPLNAMIGFQHLMLFSQQLDADNSHMAERSIANSQRLLNLINNILDISRIATGGLKIVSVKMSPGQLAKNIGTDLSLQAKEKGLTLNIEVADNVPESVTHDEERMGQIMLNLVGNALKFTDKGGTITLRMREETRDEKERLVIEVQDTGIGIPASQKHVIFDDFVQLDNSSTRKHQGAGLGLAIVKRLVLLMQGSITVESEIGQGSTFVVTLPLNLNPEMYK